MTGHYSLALRLVHWLTAVLVAGQVGLALANIALYEPRPVLAEWLVQAHITLGFAVFALTLLRLPIRGMSKSPLPSRLRVLRIGASVMYAALYLFLLALPATGYLKLAALGFQVEVAGLIPLPTLPVDISLARAAEQAHMTAAYALAGALVLHVSAAVFHERLDGRRVLPHMGFARFRTLKAAMPTKP